MTTTRGPLEVVEGFYVSQAVWALYQLNVFEHLRSPTRPAELARLIDCDEPLLQSLLEYVYQMTGLLQRHGDRFSIVARYTPYESLGFHLDKFVGAYGPALARLPDILQRRENPESCVDRVALARAFAGLSSGAQSLTCRLLRAWGVSSLLDLGCGTGNLLIELAISDPQFRGWGIDADPAMCHAATERIEREGLSGRLRVAQADVRRLEAELPEEAVRDVDVVYVRSVINGFFYKDDAEAEQVIAGIKLLFSDRLAFIEDYYGKLGQPSVDAARYRHTLLQDIAQMVSGQGVPPADLKHWASLYKNADCHLLHAYEGDNNGVQWFVHVVQL